MRPKAALLVFESPARQRERMSTMAGHYNMGAKLFCVILANCEESLTADWKEVTATWQGDLNFLGENTKGGTVKMGPMDESIGPMQLLLVGLAGCTGIDIVSILKKKQVFPTNFKVVVRGKRGEKFPMIYTDIEVEYFLWGDTLKVRDVEQAIKLSEKKYCSVSIMLGKTAKISSTYKILKPGESEV
jgi:putative redox protein